MAALQEAFWLSEQEARTKCLSVWRGRPGQRESSQFGPFSQSVNYRACRDPVYLCRLFATDKQRNRKIEGENIGNMPPQPWKRMFGMWVVCRPELRRVDASSESLGEETGDLTMWHQAFYRYRGSRDGSKWITLPRSGPLPACECHGRCTVYPLFSPSYWDQEFLSHFYTYKKTVDQSKFNQMSDKR